ncbi:putative TPR repeat-containing protein At1g05150 [Wolffia australiana]
METGSGSGALELMAEKVRRIFQRFDGNGDGGLDRGEMAALVVAVNPRVKFSEPQINAILDEVFRTYAGFISPERGLTLNGLLRTYEDGAGDVDRDFDALRLSLDDPPLSVTSSVDLGPSSPAIALVDRPSAATHDTELRPPRRPASSPGDGAQFRGTWQLVEDLQGLIRKLRLQQLKKNAKAKAGDSSHTIDSFSEAGWSRELGPSGDGALRFVWDEGTREFSNFRKELEALRARVDRGRPADEAFDGHMALGRCLYERLVYGEALASFRRAGELRPADARPRFHSGNALHALGRQLEAKEEFVLALEAAESSGNQYASLLPQIHVNLGIAMEGEGMLLGACEHYREAAILRPSHFRALKLLGSALFGVGEVRAAEKALEEAIFLCPDYADARCDLGSVLHRLGEDERAIQEFQKAIDLKPGHVDALYNLGGLLLAVGRFPRASEMYSRVLTVRPNHWRAQLNKAVSLLGAGEADDARRSLQEAFKMSKRVELHDALSHIRALQKKKLLKGGSAEVENNGYLVIEPSRFKQFGRKTTSREELMFALQIRAFQVVTKLSLCDVDEFLNEVGKAEVPLSHPGNGAPEKSIRKAALEVILRKLLESLKPEAFQGAMKAVNEKVLSVLDSSGSGRVDAGLFFAILAPLCAGSLDRRKRAAFEALKLQPDNGTRIRKVSAITYLNTLRAIFIPSLGAGAGDVMEIGRNSPDFSVVSFPEFIEMFDDPERGFKILSTLVKLELRDRKRHGGYYCSTCRYPIIGSRFKEITQGFSLCSYCYSEGRVPSAFNLEEYSFKEYETETDTMKDKCVCFQFHPKSNLSHQNKSH